MSNTAAKILLAISVCTVAAQALAGGQDSYVFCDNGLRCVTAPCPSNSALDLATGELIKGVSIDIEGLTQEDKALDLSDKLYAGKVVVVGSIENRTQTFNGKQHTLPWLVATAIERAARDGERGHCSAH
ncbi:MULTISPECIES: hypothetical protein [unclassified Mesorhizobium]|uniref:hypothetical protein n=1 Tax=unclassified Mesorhizobium TaxID=325217 RepID=UPI000FDB4697|nr:MULTISPECIES: hypothetical protein [unclassified Mesorhizobium]TGQ45970.1 hypothetical protein EN859_006475 [Mesorhizobium sp. M00.F.Ca.ET.216.01.1.1]TIS59477.1 MAG: hypothetical protein E5W91_05620 [Mesorhizobium sp.]TIS91134.1 MAG: hypothetical protein E5W89_09275 [Mesorhizobium sp.]TJW07425.1 MAG: hypothetical protein E5W82_23410 [Mesorhizobium sp.]TJW46455.1 MAG: hypothetical protein E5W83_08900 [Mesorhizobium sp.]